MTEDPAPYGSISPYDPPPDPEARLRRVFEAAGCRTQLELAKVLGVRQSSVSDAKRRGSIPAEWLLKLLLLRGVHPAWVLTGHGPRRCLCLSVAQARAGPLSSEQCHDSEHPRAVCMRQKERREALDLLHPAKNPLQQQNVRILT